MAAGDFQILDRGRLVSTSLKIIFQALVKIALKGLGASGFSGCRDHQRPMKGLIAE
jgi:hypothetical protein